jgi:hypothetical protein
VTAEFVAQEAKAAVAEREREAEDNIQIGLNLQQQNEAAASELEAHRSAVTEATADLRALKLELDGLIKAVGEGVEEAAAGEARAAEAWALAREHVASVAAGGAEAADALREPVVQARSHYLLRFVTASACAGKVDDMIASLDCRHVDMTLDSLHRFM